MWAQVLMATFAAHRPRHLAKNKSSLCVGSSAAPAVTASASSLQRQLLRPPANLPPTGCRVLSPFKQDMDVNLCQTSRFPVSHKRICSDIKGNKTDIAICSYDDHFLIIVTQIGSMGTILHARKEESVSTDPTFNVSVLFGKRDEPLLVACARQLIEHISNCGSSRQLVLSLGLKDHSVETLKTIASAVIENRMW